MTKFKLPDILGGIEVEDVGDQVHGLSTAVQTLMSHVTVEVPGVGLVRIARNKLTEVEPPLPEEPPVGAVVLDRDGDVWARKDQGDKPWECGGLDADWEHLNNRYGPVVRMVPDPVASAPELPWEYRDEDRIPFGVQLHAVEPLIAFDSTCPRYYMPLDQAEQMALAILRAVREARAAS